MFKRLVHVTTLAISLFATASSQALDLTVRITGLASDSGDVHVALYDKAEGFPKGDGMMFEIEVPIAGRVARTVFRDLNSGRYAIATYHDENSNDDFDQGLLGIPLEAYGFSNGAVAFFGPPSFEDASFELAEPSGLVVIDLGD